VVSTPKASNELGYELPEFLDVDPTKPPTRHFTKGPDNKLIEVAGRRPSTLLCVPKLRSTVESWRNDGYPGASETTRHLFRWWFEEAKLHDGFKPYFVQREAIETLVYLLEICGGPHLQKLINDYHQLNDAGMIAEGVEFNHKTTGELLVQIPGHGAAIELSPDDVARYAVKAATGSGKTMIMALFITWSYFHSTREQKSSQAANFLVVAPNVIVFERLKTDFANSKVFREVRLAPPGWNLDLHVILRGDEREPVGRGNLVVTNIQQLYDVREKWTPKNAIERILGKPVVKGAAPGRPMAERLKSLKNLAVLNDEAHHVHDTDLEWHKVLSRLHAELPDGLTAWLDFSATPRFESGAFFPWIVSDYPLAQAVEDMIVKTPTLIKTGFEEPGITSKGKKRAIKQKLTAAQYSDFIHKGVARLKAIEREYRPIKGAKPVMFVMCENVKHAEDVAAYIRDGRYGFGIKADEVLVIHTKGKGEVKDTDLDELRRQARLIDEQQSKIRVVVSVLILREGWDVRNVSVVLGLRPANSKNEILPEQAVGRGLRLMREVAGRQVLEVIGTQSFEELLGQLEVEGVHINRPDKDPQQHRIEPLAERLKFDIAIPQTGQLFQRNKRKLGDLKASDIPTDLTVKDLKTDLIKARVVDIASGADLGELEMSGAQVPLEGELIAGYVTSAMAMAGIADGFQTLYPIVRQYIKKYAFGEEINLELENVRRVLSLPAYETWIVASIADAVGQTITDKATVRVAAPPLKLSETQAFVWRRDVSKAQKTIFNYVATFNKFETEFGAALDEFKDVKAFSALAETFTRFSVDYLKPTGAMGRYYPDWAVHQRVGDEDRFWIVETKGREFDGVEQKDAAIAHWCSEVSKLGTAKWGYLRVNQDWWNSHDLNSFEDVARGIQAHQKANGATGLYFWPN
jgi:type III restriction enzyme